MKKLLFLAFALALIACKEDPKVDYAVISGKITNKLNGDVSINSLDRSFTENITISNDGIFQDTLSTDINSYVLFDGVNPIFLSIEPGYNLIINYDAKDFSNTLSIRGTGSEVNNYLAAKRKNEKKLFGNGSAVYSLGETALKDKLLAIKSSQDSLLNSTEGISSDYLTKEKRNLQYDYLNKLKDYENVHRYFSKNSTFTVSEGFLNEFDDFDYSNESDFSFSNAYKAILTDYYNEKAKTLVEKDSIADDMAFIKTVNSIKSTLIKNTLLYDYANYNMNRSKDIEAFYQAFLKHSTDEKKNALITEKYNKITALAKGKPSPQFNNYENHAGGTTSLTDLKGKYVYIDVWATWCGPCVREIPSLKKIEEQYHDKNIEFVSLSIDRVADYDKWKTMVNEKELGGMQLFADKDWQSSFVRDYQIEGIPRFILIDTESNIVDANAPRPSNPALVDLFLSLDL
ncbi:hypothetical protein GCM10023311_26030 [Flaviramulus aquimarinus]|uniref:Thioredoxin domain-containing protein n=1 Tax=Flaviramulus aquimarinus TaxID=1170456 RepID=A0ABP9FEJ6_9FLAO